MTRRELLALGIGGLGIDGAVRAAQAPRGRTVVVMMDGFGTEYYQASNMPTLKKWAREGAYARVRGQMPAEYHEQLST